jgi:hypothetical protein
MDTYPPVNTDNWVQIGIEKKSGVLNVIKDSSDVADMTVAWFKYRINNDAGPIPANEFICSKLGQLLHLPVAKIQFKEFAGHLGTLSFIVAPEPNKWAHFPYKTSLPAHIENYDLLAEIIVFDVFINNLDRNPDNIIYSKVPTRRNKYFLHLIDHGHCLLGPSTQPTPKDNYNFDQHIQLNEFKELLTNGIDYFHDAIMKVQQITETNINEILELVPSEYLTDEQKIAAKDMLLHRAETIYNEFEVKCRGG